MPSMVIHKAGRARPCDSGSMSRTPGAKIGIHAAQVLAGRSASRVDIRRGGEARAVRGARSAPADESGRARRRRVRRRPPFGAPPFELVPLDVGAQSATGPHRFTGQERRGLGLWGAMTQFVGRHDEFEVLLGPLLAAAGMGRASSWRVVGGLGWASRASSGEFTHSHHVHGWPRAGSGRRAHGKTTPYLPVIDLLKTYCGIGDRDDQRATGEKVTASSSLTGVRGCRCPRS